MTDAKALRNGQPLHAAEIGTVNGQVVGIWHNWDRLIVKNVDGTELLCWESYEGLIHQTRLVNHRYLCIALGAGISVHCVKVYDFAQKSWQKDRPLGSRSVESAILSTHATSPLLCVNTCLNATKVHTEVWDLDQPGVRWPVEMNQEFDCADFIDANSMIGYDSHDVFLVKHDGSHQVLYHSHDIKPLHLIDHPEHIATLHRQANITAIKWLSDNQAILLGDAGGTLSLFTSKQSTGNILGRFSDGITRIDCYDRDCVAISTYDDCVHLLNIKALTQKKLPNAFGIQVGSEKLITLCASTTTFVEIFP